MPGPELALDCGQPTPGLAEHLGTMKNPKETAMPVIRITAKQLELAEEAHEKALREDEEFRLSEESQESGFREDGETDEEGTGKEDLR